MRRQIEGSRAVAETVALCRPEVICAYPISPQTHIVENLSVLVKSGALAPCEFINVESEFAALSVAIGASAAGARAYTATASQGLLYMAEAVYNAAGLGLPIVMTLANRAVGAPINIWNDHSDAMALRDSGWIQLFAESSQEAADLHVIAFRLAEELSVPVMVCMDGFVLTHAVEEVDMPTQGQVDAFLPRFVPRQVLDPADPTSIGAMVGPEAFTEVRWLAHLTHVLALERIVRLSGEFQAAFDRPAGGLLRVDNVRGAETVVVAMGSVLGTIKDTADALRDEGMSIGVLGIGSFRPFPVDALRAALRAARQVVVIDRCLAPGTGGVLTGDVRLALAGMPARVHGVIAGLGGRPVTSRSLRSVFADAAADRLGPLTVLDLDVGAMSQELGELHRRGLAASRRADAPMQAAAGSRS